MTVGYKTTIAIWNTSLREGSVKITMKNNKRDAQKRHEPGYEAIPGPLEHVEKDGEERSTNHEHQEPVFQHVGDEERGRGLVEPMFFFEHKGLVDRKWGGDRRGNDEEDSGKREGLDDLCTGESARRNTSAPLTSYSGPYPNCAMSLPATPHAQA